MSIFLPALAYTFYFVVLLGLVLHTSDVPVLLSKYSVRHAVLMFAIVALFVPYRSLVAFSLRSSALVLSSGRTIVLSPRRKLAVSVILGAVCVLLILFPLEVRARFAASSRAHSIDEFHPFLQNRLPANDPLLHVNAHGFRGDEIASRKPPNTFRVFILGGSTVLSRDVAFEKSHARILEKLLNARHGGMRIEVLNGGDDWHTSEHSLIKYLFNIKDFDPDLIIVWHGINDLHRSFAPPEFASPPVRADYSHFYGPISRMVFNHFDRSPPVVNLESVDCRAISDRLLSLFFSDLTAHKERRGPCTQRIEITSFPSLGAFRRNMASLVTAARSDGVRVVIASQPFLYREGLDADELASLWMAQQFCRVEGYKCPSVRSMASGMKQFNEATRAVAMHAVVPFVDLAARVPQSKKYLRDDCHYTEEGNDLVAHVLFDSLEEGRLIQRMARTEVQQVPDATAACVSGR